VGQRHGRIGPWYRTAVVVVKPTSTLLTRRDWRGQENIPRSGGVIVAANHVSHLDPLTLAHFVYDAGRVPRYLAKSELFRGAFLGRLFRGAAQIPVHRGSADATLALRDAIAAVRRGECLLIYPEGTITRDPAGWPMTARTGVARLALQTGAPVIPIAQWGIQDILPAYTKRPHLLPRKAVHVLAGPPVDLARWTGEEQTAPVLRAATAAVMAAIRELLGELRGERPPETVFDPGAARAASGAAEPVPRKRQ
jgi:1-acyl-sn-glycerol-3-phosphate acyltransferase